MISLLLALTLYFAPEPWITCSQIIAKQRCVMITHLEGNLDDMAMTVEERCNENAICNKTFKITYIDTMPYSEIGLDYMFVVCCGKCVRVERTVLRNITQLTEEIIRSSDFVYPILADDAIPKLYGSHYLPYVEVPSIVYITKTKELDFIGNIFSVYPVIIICLLMALVAGFVGWAIETNYNEKQFPREFWIGWFEGFWWSFVSLTTVGYGDKVPRSLLGRLFAVVWIIIGMATFGIVIGELTGQILAANNPQAPRMEGQMVGALRYRDYDAYMVSQSDGIVVRNVECGDFNTNLFGLIEKLQNDEISGFVLDKWTLWYVTVVFAKGAFPNKTDQVEFFLKGTTRVEVPPPLGDKLSFGMLVKNHDDLEYFKEFAKDSHLRSKMIYGEMWIKVKMESLGETFHSSGSSILFETSSYFFRNTMTCIIALLFSILAFGLLYELNRYYLHRKGR